jgi:hypothetical protein
MRTPAGFECKYFYGNYFRGRNIEECRLLKDTDPKQIWKPALCNDCPTPKLILANACEFMQLEGRVVKYFFGFKQSVRVTASCDKSGKIVRTPEVGCGLCHPIPDVIIKDEN